MLKQIAGVWGGEVKDMIGKEKFAAAADVVVKILNMYVNIC